jgi:hypothetical protein
MTGRPLSFAEFRQKYLKKNVCDSFGKPLHGRYIKKYLYRYAPIIKKHGLDMHRCNSCGMKDRWCSRPIKMELHHKNGIINDNRLANFEMLCPNCHSQTPNYKGRKSL